MTENPYATPESEVAVPIERNDFKDIPTKELKNLRNDSHSIRAVVFLIFLGLAILVIGGLATGNLPLGPELLIMAVIFGINIAAAIGLMKRAVWGRILGFVVASLMLFGFPVGTLIGIMVLVALSRGGRLFGPDRFHHKALEAEWRLRKRNKIA